MINTKALASLALLAITSLTASATDGFVTVDGQNLTTPEEKTLYIQGTNLGNWLNPEGYMFGFSRTNSAGMINDAFCQLVGPEYTAEFWNKFKDNYITAEDIDFIAKSGANTIRLPFHYKLFTDEDYMGLSGKQDGFKRVDSLVNWCRNAGLYLILDMHDAPAGQTGDNIDDSYGYPWLMVSPKAQKQFCDIWRSIARRYKDEPVILGYELINEPVATYFKDEEDFLNSQLVEVMKMGIRAIREVDPNHIILVGSPQWNSNFSPLEGVDWGDENIMFTCHRYGGDPTPEAIKSYIDFRNATGKPMYMGEIGHNTDKWQADFVKTMKDNNISYTFWPYKKCKDSCMNGFDLPENWDTVRNFAEAPRGTYKEIRQAWPDRNTARAALDALLENIKYKNCHPQTSYIESMGLK